MVVSLAAGGACGVGARAPAAAAHAHAHGEGWARERCRLELSSARRESETSITIYGYVGNCKCGTIADDGMGCEMHPIPTAWKRDGQPRGRAGIASVLAVGCWLLALDEGWRDRRGVHIS